MTDKVQKIRAEIEKRISRNKRNKVFEDVPEKRHQLIIEGQLLGELKHFIDSMQKEPTIPDIVDEHFWKMLGEEPISEGLNTESMIESYKQRLVSQANGMKNSPLIDMCLASYKHGINETLDTLKLSNLERTTKNREEKPVSEELEKAATKYAQDKYMPVQTSQSFKAGAQWQKQRDNIPSKEWEEAMQHSAPDNIGIDDLLYCRNGFIAGAKWQKEKDESTTEDLGNYINELSKQFPEVSFAKLSRIAVRVAKWQKENLWKPADGDDLPEIDREVVVLIKYDVQLNIHDEEYPTYRVGFGHRPNPDGWDGRNIDTNVVTHYTPKLYDKGGWNQPHVLFWLDARLPYEENKITKQE